jgi:hypothetical protein
MRAPDEDTSQAALDRDVRVRTIVGPELVLRVSDGPRQDRPCRGGGLTLADEQAQQAALFAGRR